MTAQTSNEMWKSYIGHVQTTLALPDYYANYFGYAFQWESNPQIGLRITGDFGYARYMSFNIYDMVSGTSLAALKDVSIEADAGSFNPFNPAPDNDPTARKYTVNVFCTDNSPDCPETEPDNQPGSSTVSNAIGPSCETLALGNQLTFSGEQRDVGILLVVLRYYLPTDAGGNPNDEAGVLLPQIEAFDIRSVNPTDQSSNVPLPQNLAVSKMPKALYGQRMDPVFSTIVDDTLRFYRVEGSGQYNNMDNAYLINAVEKGEDEVLLINLHAPEYAHNNSQNNSAEVRYWSFNQGDADTSTPFGLPDTEFKRAENDRTYIAMGDESIKEHALAGGYNFMPWKATSKCAVVLYRNLVTNTQYPGRITKVAPVTALPFCNSQDAITYDAINFIGKFAPTGKKVTKEEFMANYGGIPSPGFKKN